jgi:hypothetical protein
MLDMLSRAVTVLESSARRWAAATTSAEHCCTLLPVEVLMSRQMAVGKRASSHDMEDVRE